MPRNFGCNLLVEVQRNVRQVCTCAFQVHTRMREYLMIRYQVFLFILGSH